MATVSYVGSKGTHLGQRYDLNQLRPVPASANPYAKGQPVTGQILAPDGVHVLYVGDCLSQTAGPGGPVIPGYNSDGVAADQTPGTPGVNMYVACGNNPDFFRPYVGYSDIRAQRNTASSIYHGLQLSARRTVGTARAPGRRAPRGRRHALTAARAGAGDARPGDGPAPRARPRDHARPPAVGGYSGALSGPKKSLDFLDAADAAVADQLVVDLTARPVADRYGYLAAVLLLRVRRADSRALVERKLAAALKLDGPMVKKLLNVSLPSQSGSKLFPIEDFLPPAASTFVRLQKAATLVQKLSIGIDEIEIVIPVLTSSATLFQAWARAVDTFALRDRLQAGPRALFQLIGAASPKLAWETFRDNSLSKVTGWPVSDLETLKTNFGFAYPNDFKNEKAYVKLSDAFAMLQHLGVSATTAIAWTESFVLKLNPSPWVPYSDQTATDIKKAAKAHYNAAGWLAAEKPVIDGLRDQQRAAMVSYLLIHTTDPASQKPQHRVYGEANDIYADLLVDVQTSPAVQTSRLVQATGSAQLFVQRCLLGLEKVSLHADEVERWSWMKFYRVWEAGRRVFLYPENWIVPALRDDKTDLFKALEATLQKQAVTTDVAEGAIRTYLEGMLEVSHLEIAAVYSEPSADEGSDGDSIYHVFGRTRATPVVYYHRKWVGRRQWTAWEKLPVSIDSEVVLPLAYKGRLFLFWPIIKAKNDPTATTDLTTPTKGKQHLEIQFAWSERKHDHWTGKRLAQGVVTVNSSMDDDKIIKWDENLEGVIPRNLFFTTGVNNSAPRIFCGFSVSHDGSRTARYIGEATWDPYAGTASCTQYSRGDQIAISQSLPTATVPYSNNPLWAGKSSFYFNIPQTTSMKTTSSSLRFCHSRSCAAGRRPPTTRRTRSRSRMGTQPS